MQRAQLIPLGAGVIAALLHLSVTTGSPGAFMLAYFAQAPIVATGLALGFMPAAVAAAVAAVLVALGSPGVGALSLFVLTSALPVLIIVYFATGKAKTVRLNGIRSASCSAGSRRSRSSPLS